MSAPQIAVSFSDRALVAADRAVAGLQFEHRLARFLGHRDQRAIVLQEPQTSADRRGDLDWITESRYALGMRSIQWR